jgi:long-chain fatty acid transport protein
MPWFSSFLLVGVVGWLMVGVASLALAAGPANTGMFATADSAETVYTTPAGMTRLEGTQKTLGSLIVHSFSTFEVDDSLTTTGGGNPDEDDFPVGIPAFYYVRPFGEDWRAGFSLNVPAGFGSSYGKDWAGRYYSDEFSLVFIGFNPAVAYRVNKWLSLGGALGINYTLSNTKTRINNPGSSPDGKVEIESSGFGISFLISAMLELSPHTRIGLNYRTESDSDLDAEADFDNLVAPPNVLAQLEDVADDIEIGSTVPQQVQLGLFHEFGCGLSVAADLMWLDFSEFGVTDVSISNLSIEAPDDLYKDFWAASIGLGFPINDQIRGGVGLFYLDEPVTDHERTLSMALDRIWGIGAGIQYQLASGNTLDVNLNFYDTGKAPVDTGSDPDRGRVVGDFDDHVAMGLDIAYHWR